MGIWLITQQQIWVAGSDVTRGERKGGSRSGLALGNLGMSNLVKSEAVMEVSGSCRRPTVPNGWLVGGTGELVLVNLQQQSDSNTTPCFMSLPLSAKAPNVVSMAS